MGRGSSGAAGGGGGGTTAVQQQQEFQEAFAPGKDFEAVGGVDHVQRTVSRMTQQEWEQYASDYGADISSADEQSIMKDWDGNGLYGYVRTTNAMALNAAFYNNPGKAPDQIFSARTKQGRRDRQTVDALDRAIASHTTPNDGLYYRFCSPKSLQRSYGLTDSEMNLVLQAPKMNSSQLAKLNSALRGTRSSSAGYTSMSANRSLNAFKNPTAKQSNGYIIERRCERQKRHKRVCSEAERAGIRSYFRTKLYIEFLSHYRRGKSYRYTRIQLM